MENTAPSDAPLDDITAVVVSYNSAEVIGRCLQSIGYLDNKIVVDNASADDTPAKLARAYPSLKVMRNDTNLGFGTGLNVGLAQVATPFLLSITPDAEVDRDVLTAMRAELLDNPGAAVAVPALDLPRHGSEMWVMGPREMRQRRAEFAAAGPFCTWFVSAAVALFRTEALQRVGGFDEAIFLYNEDLDLSFRLSDAGYALLALPGLKARHINSGSARPSAKLHWRKDWNFAWGELYLLAKRKGREQAMQAAVKIVAKRLPKAIFYILCLDRKRFIRDAATACGAIAFMQGRRPKPRD